MNDLASKFLKFVSLMAGGRTECDNHSHIKNSQNYFEVLQRTESIGWHVEVAGIIWNTWLSFWFINACKIQSLLSCQ